MKKINVGAGARWHESGWEVLDNGSGDYSPAWKHKGKCWDSGLPSSTYDIVFCSHMLEHVPHFRLERTIAEFNRILKVGGTIRILVPDLRGAARAYVEGDIGYFSDGIHFTDHLGIGGAFVRTIISPGKQTLAVSREFDEIIGSYGHLYGFDSEMLSIVLEKWGFGSIQDSKPGKSRLESLQPFQHLVHNGQAYSTDDPFVATGEFQRTGHPWHFGGFDKRSNKQIAVEAVKVEDRPYAFENEYPFSKAGRVESRRDRLKLLAFGGISRLIDGTYAAAKTVGLLRLLR